MDCEALIDFNSPLKGSNSMMDPLVPLPIYQTNHTAEVPTTVGDNPFDNVILQLCSSNDPFEIMEKQALETSTGKSVLSPTQDFVVEETCESKEISKEKNKQNSMNMGNSTTSQLKSNFEVTDTSAEDCSTLDANQSASFLKRSMSESYLSSTIKKINNKFSKMSFSSQFDKLILDESSMIIDCGIQDVSTDGNSMRNVSQKTQSSFDTFDVPTRKEDIKAFVASRIEKCIEKALNNSKSLNCSVRHRRSLSAASLYSSNLLPSDNHFTSTYMKQNVDSLSNSFKYRNRSVSNLNLHAPFTAKTWGSQNNIFGAYSQENLSNTTDRWNTGFRKSTATSSMYSSCGIFDTGFRKSLPSLSSYRPSVSSVSSVQNHSFSKISGDDSVFLNDTVIMGGKSSSCVFMEAKNLSSILKRRAQSECDEPIEADVNFLTDGNFQVDLVDSDSSSVEDIDENTCVSQIRQNSKCSVTKDTTKITNKNGSKAPPCQCSKEPPLPLSRDKISGMGLRTSNLQSKKSRNPVLVPAPPVPLASTSDSGKAVLKPKLHSDSRVVLRGPMKAMIPVGNMMRNETNSESDVQPKRNVAPQQKGVLKLLPRKGGMRRSLSTGELSSHKNKNSTEVSSKAKSPAALPCGNCSFNPVACSTPAPEDPLPLVSPPVGLQVSRILSGTPVITPDLSHRRSKSAGSTASNKIEKECRLTSTPTTRKAPQHLRSENGILKSKQRSPINSSPEQPPVYTSTPLKSITKNSPSLNRMKKPSLVSRKLLQRDSAYHLGKENLQPGAAGKHRPSARRMEV